MTSTLDFINYCYDIRADNGFLSIWSGPKFETPDLPHPFYEKEGLVLVYKMHWGEETVRVPVAGTTYLDLWAAADKAIRASGDDHHIFVEMFELNEAGELEMFTGS